MNFSGMLKPTDQNMQKGEMKTHMRWDWGMTLCGRDGWRHVWSKWEHPDSLKSTDRKAKITCLSCLSKMRRTK